MTWNGLFTVASVMAAYTEFLYLKKQLQKTDALMTGFKTP